MDQEKKNQGKTNTDQRETLEKLLDSLNPLAGYLFWVKVIDVVVVAIGGYFALARFGVLPDIFKAKPVVIADTPVLITEMKELAELFSVSQYHEVIVDSTISEKSQLDQAFALLDFDTYTERSVVYIAHGKVYAGFDLSALHDSSLVVKDSVLTIKLHSPEIMDVIVNPNDFALFEQTGEWSFDELTAIKARAKDMIRRRAIESSILERSEKAGVESLKAFYSSMGFKKVDVEVVGAH